MSVIKIILDKDETIEGAKDELFKALNSQRNGDLHTEDFADPAMRDIIARMQTEHKEIYDEMMREIFEELDKEYSNGHF